MRLGALAVLLVASVAHADGSADLAAAGRLLLDGDYERAREVVAPMAGEPTLLPAERAEAHRIHGLALFFLGRRGEAEGALRAYLQLEPDAHLDPALYPPDAVVFLEEIRTRHAGELRIARPPAKRRRYAGLNLVPPFGQIQNGDVGKAWVIGSAEIVLLAVNISTYAMLRSSCKPDLTCDRSASASRALRTTNLVSGGLFFAVWAYGIIDGYVGYGRAGRREPLRVAVIPSSGGLLLGASGGF